MSNFYYVNIQASFDANSLIDPQQVLSNYGNSSTYLNTVPGTQQLSIVAHDNNQYSKLNISSNGITDGNFNLYPIKYVGENVNFIIQIKDLSGYNIKDYPLLDIDNFKFLVRNNTYGGNSSTVTVTSNFGNLSAQPYGGYFKGTFKDTYPESNVTFIAILTTVLPNLTGYSSTISFYPSGYPSYDIRKVNENFDQTAAFKSLVYQPVLIDKSTTGEPSPMFFDNLLGQIVGNANSDPNTLGIEVYEKIANYISNINDIEYCNLNQLKSLFDMLNVSYQNFSYQYPPSFKRLVDILSVKHKKLFGQINQFQGNFDPKGSISKQIYGKNKGDKLNVKTSLLTAGPSVYPSQVIAHEKFSNIYTLVNTNLPTLQPLTTTLLYPLSNFDSTWGWNLVLPAGVSGIAIQDYYDFYNFKPGIESSPLQQFIDFSNTNTTLLSTNSSYDAFTQQGGIIDNILLYNLFTNLEILS
jgi:hypothetical protein